jgi:hypothetical protein
MFTRSNNLFQVFIIDKFYEVKFRKSNTPNVRAGRIYRHFNQIELPNSFKRRTKLEQKIMLYVMYFSVQDFLGPIGFQQIYKADEHAVEQLVLEGYKLSKIHRAYTNLFSTYAAQPLLSEKRLDLIKNNY